MTSPLHVGLIAQGGAGWMGGSEYIRNLIRALESVPESSGDPPKVTLILGEKQKAEWDGLGDTGRVVVGRKPRPLPVIGRWIPPSNRHFLGRVEAAGCNFVYPFTYDNQYNVDVTLPLGAGRNSFHWAGWIPDFQHRHLPGLFSEKEIEKRDRGIGLLVAEAAKVVLSSHSAKADLERYHPEAMKKAEVLTFATFPKAEWYSEDCGEDLTWLPRRFFVVSNQFWKHKNHLVVFEALRALAGRGVKPVVVCTGQIQDFRDPDYANLVLQTVHKSGLSAQVLLLGLVSRRTQIEMMRRSLAVVQPSLFEGWSTVVEDARVLGKRCLLSDISVHREQNPPGALFFDPHSADSLAEVMTEAWNNLVPGPLHEEERVARQCAENRIIDVGCTFTEIARRACAAE